MSIAQGRIRPESTRDGAAGKAEGPLPPRRGPRHAAYSKRPRRRFGPGGVHGPQSFPSGAPRDRDACRFRPGGVLFLPAGPGESWPGDRGPGGSDPCDRRRGRNFGTRFSGSRRPPVVPLFRGHEPGCLGRGQRISGRRCLAAAVAAFGLALEDAPSTGTATLDQVLDMVADPDVGSGAERREWVDLVTRDARLNSMRRETAGAAASRSQGR